MVFLMIFHALVCVLLVLVVLMQSGRGGGLTESFSAAENLFGTRTNEFLVRTTAVLAVIFLVSSLALANMSAKRDQSLLDRLMDKSKEPDIKINIPIDEPASEAVVPETSPVPGDPAASIPDPAAVQTP